MQTQESHFGNLGLRKDVRLCKMKETFLSKCLLKQFDDKSSKGKGDFDYSYFIFNMLR